MLLVWVLIVLERAKSSILPNGNFREFFLWRGGGILRFKNGNSRWPWCCSCMRLLRSGLRLKNPNWARLLLAILCQTWFLHFLACSSPLCHPAAGNTPSAIFRTTGTIAYTLFVFRTAGGSIVTPLIITILCCWWVWFVDILLINEKRYS